MTTAPRDIELKPAIGRLLEAAVQAPSPDNNQPWWFRSSDSGLLVYHDGCRALPSDVGGMFSAIALGSAIENICIAAGQMGFTASVKYAAIGKADLCAQTSAHVATLRFEPGGSDDGLGPAISARCTCRKPYLTQPVPEHQLRELSDECRKTADCCIHWVTDRRRIRELARLVRRADLLRFQYRLFHEELYRQLRFTPAEAEQTRDGLDLRTLELPPGAAAVLRWLGPWRRMKRLHRLGLGHLLTLPSARLTRRSGALGLMTVTDLTPQRCLDGGRALQRLWLAATVRKLSLHPLGSLPIFLAQLDGTPQNPLAEWSRLLLETMRDQLGEAVPGTRNGRLLMLFRLGYATAPAVRSLRREPEIRFEKASLADQEIRDQARSRVTSDNRQLIEATDECL